MAAEDLRIADARTVLVVPTAARWASDEDSSSPPPSTQILIQNTPNTPSVFRSPLLGPPTPLPTLEPTRQLSVPLSSQPVKT
ncbi:hypothetical protein K435DRAFT_855129 [Dendrothele bispora CBS 962.96]|uniref:Uncharacterized protein n=1 Tax=Dendrothele bispora (strain CBS 962.96) TaxID=1314807 RepID=A0A4S8MBZ3_DENBC|nr:hypothetical protein K435DRAFT_855129 [Dendrothele bispora CBS 962.96]